MKRVEVEIEVLRAREKDMKNNVDNPRKTDIHKNRLMV
jgi:hypothetical protein